MKSSQENKHKEMEDSVHARGCYDVPRVLMADARSLRALAAILDRMSHLEPDYTVSFS